MTPKEKADQLVKKFTWQREEFEKYVAKECAKSCVDEIIAALDEVSIGESGRVHIDYGQGYFRDVIIEIDKIQPL